MVFKDIVNEWQEQFPNLSPYTPTTLFARADILLIGLRLDRRWDDEYSVSLEILPLWVSKDKITIPYLEEDLLDKKGFQISLETRLHDPLLTDYVEAQKKRGVVDIDIHKFELEKNTRFGIIRKAIECAHEQFNPVLQKNVGLSVILRFIKAHTESRRFDRRNPLDWYHLFELKLALAYHFGREDMVNEVKTEIKKETEHWNQKRFQDLFHKSIKEWKEDLYQRMEDREAFMNQVEQNLSLKKISRLKEIHIHNDVDLSQSFLKDVEMTQSSHVSGDKEPDMPLLQRILRFLKGY